MLCSSFDKGKYKQPNHLELKHAAILTTFVCVFDFAAVHIILSIARYTECCFQEGPVLQLTTSSDPTQ